MIITAKFLNDNPDHIFVFGDNNLRHGKRGAARLRDFPNSYGFITKKYPSNKNDAFYKPSEYNGIFKREMDKLIEMIRNNPDKTFLISKIGSGLANKYKIWEKVIQVGIQPLLSYKNVQFLF